MRVSAIPLRRCPQDANVSWFCSGLHAYRTSWAWLDERLASDLWVERLLYSMCIKMLRQNSRRRRKRGKNMIVWRSFERQEGFDAFLPYLADKKGYQIHYTTTNWSGSWRDTKSVSSGASGGWSVQRRLSEPIVQGKQCTAKTVELQYPERLER